MWRRVAIWTAVVGVVVGAVGAAQAATTKVSPFDRHFVVTAAENNTFELAAAAVARSRGASTGLCDFAARLIEDHKRSATELTKLAAQLRVAAPTRLSPLDQWIVTQMRSWASGTTPPSTTTGVQFNDGFWRLQAAAHRQAIRDFVEAANAADDMRVRAFARATLPTLREHLRIALKADDGNPVTPGCKS
jgi:putative membrane protein